MSRRRVVAEIDLTNIDDNIKAIHDHMPAHQPIVAVLKANGYGHGAVEIARRMEYSQYIKGYAVASSEEALELRRNGIKKPILILGYVFKEDYKELIEKDVSFTIFELKSAANLNKVSETIKKKARVHIKVDTGMSRIGVSCNDEGLNLVREIYKLDNLDFEGIFTHFARADEERMEDARAQLDRFSSFVNQLKSEDITFTNVHCSNSAAILRLPEAHFSMVRAGIILYGLWPSKETITEDIRLRPALTLKSHIVYIKELEAGTPISYGGTYVTEKKCKVATVPVGYADGYPRSLSNKGYVLINGEKAAILGRVCMDQIMVDVTDIEAKVLDDVILIGRSSDKEITAEELGELSGRFNYELVCELSPRVPRIYKTRDYEL